VLGGGSGADQAAFFLDPRARILVVSRGVTFTLDEHAKLHAQWINERHPRLGATVQLRSSYNHASQPHLLLF